MSLGNALSYLTVIPIPYKRDVPLIRSVHFFPMVGAGMGSLLVLVFLGLNAFLYRWLACLGVVLVLESMTGGRHLRALAELADGRRTPPGHGFVKKAEYGWKGIVTVILFLGLKVAALASIKIEWQPFALLLTPILGRGSQALGIIFSRRRAPERDKADPAAERRQRRALVFIAVLLFCLLLFPWKVALAILAQYFLLLSASYTFLNRNLHGLTVQTLGTVAELAEIGFLTCCAVMSFLV